MDGQLVRDGLIPGVDFHSRQPLYSYILAGLLAVIGPDYASLRLVGVFISILNVYLVYLIGKRLLGGNVGVLAAGVFAFLPLNVIWAPVIHTEPFTMLLSGLGVYFLLRSIQEGNRGFLFAAGITLSLAFYVRESSFGALVAAISGLVLWSAGNLRRLATRVLLLGAGFLVPCVVIGAFYLRHLTFDQWWVSPVNPLSIFIKSLAGVSAAVSDGTTEALRLDEQSWSATISNLRSTFLLCSGLAMGLFVSAVLLLRRRLVSREDERPPPWKEIGLLYAWIGALAFMYAYWALHRGFFPQYAEEFLPPLSIVSAWAYLQLYAQWRSSKRPAWAPIGLAVIAASAFVLVKLQPLLDVQNSWYFLVPAVGLAWAAVPQPRQVARWLLLPATVVGYVLLLSWATGAAPSLSRPLKILLVPTVLIVAYQVFPRAPSRSRSNYFTYVGLTLLLAAVGMTSAASGRQVNFRFTSTWSPDAVRRVTEYLRANSRAGDEVVSGAVIWELQADRRPFARISHPLALVMLSSDRADSISASLAGQLATRPPRFIVMDGYTEQTYGARIPNLQDVLDRRYHLELSVPGSAFPVRIYQLR